MFVEVYMHFTGTFPTGFYFNFKEGGEVIWKNKNNEINYT